jgi:cytochrome c peroxidase
MIRRAALAPAALVFILSGYGLLDANATQPTVDATAARGRIYLNPMGVALSADGRRAYVALGGVNVVATVDLASGQIVRRYDTGLHPREVYRDGSTLYVVDDESETLAIDLATGAATREGPRSKDDEAHSPMAVILSSRRTESVGLAALADPAWTDQARDRVSDQVFNNVLAGGLPANQLVGAIGAMGAFGGIIGFRQAVGSLDTGRLGVADPADVAWSAPFRTLFVASSGSDVVLAYPTKTIEAKVTTASQQGGQFSGALGFAGGNSQTGWGGVATSVPLPMSRPIVLQTRSNPQRMALSDDGRTLVTSDTLADSLTVISIDHRGARVVKQISLGGPPPDARRRGEVLFHSSRLTFNGRFTCASCHPGGGTDNRVWDTPTEDPGPRRTKPLFGVAETAPYGWHGDSPTLADRVRKTVRKLHRGSPTPDQVSDLVAFLTSLPAPKPSPLTEDELQLAARGRRLFEIKGRCGRCHPGDTYQDGDLHDVGYGGAFRTPSLRGASQRTRFLHDGRAASVQDLFRNYNGLKRHGAAHELSPKELQAVIAFVKAL